MRKTDFNEILAWYNEVHGLKLKTVNAMIRNGHKKYGSYDELALKIGVSHETLRKFRKEIKKCIKSKKHQTKKLLYEAVA